MHRIRFPFAGLLLATALSAFAGERDALAAFYAEVGDLRTDFRQVQVDEDGRIVQTSAGVFFLERPDKFRWEYREPYRQVIVSDGRKFRFYDVDLAQVTVREIDATLRITPAQLLAGGAGLEESFIVEGIAGTGDSLDWMRLTPRVDDSDFREIRIALKDDRPIRLELDDQLGQTTRIDFDDIRVNRGIDGDRFRLDLPEEVDVVDADEETRP